MIPASDFRTWTPRQIEYLTTLAEEPWQRPRAIFAKMRPNTDFSPIPSPTPDHLTRTSAGSKYSATLSIWRRRPSFKACEMNIRGDPEYAARFIAWLNAPKAAKAAAEAIQSGGPSGKEKSTDVLRGLRQVAQKPQEQDNTGLLEKFLGPRLVRDGESKAG